MKKKLIISAIVLALIAVAIWFFSRPSSNEGKMTLETSKVQKIDVKNTVTATGTVEPVTEVEVGTQVSGIIDKLYVDYNDEVKVGQIIAEMDKITLEAELQSAESQLASNKTEYSYRLKEYNRIKTLHDKELVSDKEYDEAEYYYEKAKNSYEQSQASMVKVKRNLSYATITSPIDGIVISRAVEEGQTVAAGFETPTLFTIAKDLTKMKIIADVDEADIGQVKEQQRVEFTVDAYPDDVFYGIVDQVRLEPTTESNVVTYDVVIIADNPELKLKPGLTASIVFYTNELEGVLAVPTKALRFNPEPQFVQELGIQAMPLNGGAEEDKHVWVKKGMQLIETAVRQSVSSGDKTVIVSGLQEGDEVVTGISVGVAEEAGMAEGENAQRSPFMPTPPGRNKKNNAKKPQ